MCEIGPLLLSSQRSWHAQQTLNVLLPQQTLLLYCGLRLLPLSSELCSLHLKRLLLGEPCTLGALCLAFELCDFKAQFLLLAPELYGFAAQFLPLALELYAFVAQLRHVML
jgi:hypothetical protein